MKENKHTLFWGLLLIGAGALALMQQMGTLDRYSPNLWMIVFAVVSLAGFISYALSGFRDWGWLFPAGIFGGLAMTIGMANTNIESAALGSPLFFGLLIPFAAAYLLDRRGNWWALIPGGVMLFLALTTLLVDSLGGEWIGALLLFMIAVSFLTVYLNDRTRTWALIVAYATGVLGIAPIMAVGGRDAGYFGPIFLFAAALAFYVVYFSSAERWWAMIPAGTLTVLSVITLLAVSNYIQSGKDGALTNALLMGGLAATFAVVWLRNGRDWARIVTIVLGALALGSVFFISYAQVFWPIAIIAAGGYLIYNAYRTRGA